MKLVTVRERHEPFGVQDHSDANPPLKPALGVKQFDRRMLDVVDGDAALSPRRHRGWRPDFSRTIAQPGCNAEHCARAVDGDHDVREVVGDPDFPRP